MPDSMRIMMWISDTQKLCTYFNRDWLEFTGQTLEHELGHGWTAGIHPEDFDRCLATYNAAFDAREEFKMEYRLRHHSGEYRWILDAGMPRYAAGGEFNGYVGMCIDSTALRETWSVPRYHDQLEAIIAERTAELCDSEARYRRIAETMLDGIWTLGPDDEIDYVNEQTTKLLGYSADEIVGRSPLDFLFPADVPRGQQLLERRKQGIREIVETRLRRKDGSELWVLRAATPILNARGEYRGAISILSDITARKQAEDKLQQSERCLRAIVELEPECVKVISPEGALLEINSAGLVMIEADSLDQARSLCLVDLVVPEHRQAFVALAERVFRGEEGTLEFEIIGLKGTRRWLETHAVPLRDSNNNIVSLLGITRDITAHKAAVDELRRQKELLQKVFDHIPAMVSLRDGEGRLQMANREWERVTGWSSADMRDPRLFEEMYPDPQERQRVAAFRKLVRGDWSEFRTRTRDGRYVHTLWANVSLSDGTNIGIGKDITESKRIEAERQKLEMRVQDSQKMESLGLLAGGVAHDFNNLLQGILANAELARDGLDSGSPALAFLEQIEIASRRAAELTNQLLAYAGKARFRVEPLDLSQLVVEMLQLLEAGISKKTRMQGDFSAALPMVQGDPTQLRQVVMNLIVNAAEAVGDEGGAIHVSTGTARVSFDEWQQLIPAGSLDSPDCVFLEVCDGGGGMSEETLARIFEPFFTTKFTGRGLGLAAVLGIVRGHHGGIHVESTVGKGTRFRIYFPVANEPARDAALPPETSLSFRGTGTILAVDDEPLIRHVNQAVLERAGFTVISAANGREALELFRANPHAVQAVLLDLTMPEMDGAETLREIRRLRVDIPVILASGYTEDEAISQFDGAGLAGFLQKPYAAAQLLESLHRVLR